MEVTLRDGQTGEMACPETYHLWGLSLFDIFAEAPGFRSTYTSVSPSPHPELM